MTRQRWPICTLSEVARLGSGGTPKARDPDYYGGTIPWAVIGDLTDGPIYETASSITEAGLANSSAKLVPAGAVLIAMYGSIGKLAITKCEMATNQAIAFAVPDRRIIDAQYLFYYLLSQRPALATAGKGATQQNISQTILKTWPVPVPPIGEQRRIVEILEDHLSRLDAADQLVRMAERRIASWQKWTIDALVRTNSSATGTLADLVVRVEAGKSFGGSAPPATDDQWGVIKVSAMTWGRFKPEENKAVSGERIDPRFEIQPGDVLVSRANTTEYVGAPVLVDSTPPRLLLSDKSLRLVPRADVDPRWLVQVLSSPSTRRQISARATGTKDSMRSISQAALLAVRVPRATSSQQQLVISLAEAVGDAANAARTALATSKVRATHLRRALLDAASGGQLIDGTQVRSAYEEMASV